MNCVVVHYSEIGLKGKNRDFFERKLMDNIRKKLKEKDCGVYRLYGRIIIELKKSKAKEDKEIRETLLRIPGISNFSFALEAELDIKKMKKAVLSAAEGKKIRTFAVSSLRSYKKFGYTSREINEMMGDVLRKKTGWKVDLGKPDLRFFIEVTEKGAFVYTEKVKALGGLPVTSGGRLVSLISGGIDSPVSAFEMIKRGCSVVFVHFHNWGKNRDVVRDKVERIVRALSEYQPKTTLYLIPFEEIQKEIVLRIPAKYRMIVYRRIMFDIANRIAVREKALGFVTGDSLGQVASQTLENLNVIHDKAALPVFSPLIGSDKEDITARAKKIGTYELSILPYSDCCSLFVARHPETRAKKEVIGKIEKELSTEKIIDSALEKADVRKF